MKAFFGLILVAAVCGICSAELGYFWHLSDTHMQSDYKVGSNPEKGCYEGKGSAGKFGDYKCRAPFQIEDTAMMTIPTLRPDVCKDKNPLFVIWTGDAGAKRYGKFSEDYIKWEIKNLTHELVKLKKALGGNVNIYPCLGNHDSYPQHQFTATDYWVYHTVEEEWGQFLPVDARKTLKAHGYYAVTPVKGLRLIVLNTVIYFHDNNKISPSTKDPGGQLAWLRGELKKAAENNQSVFIASHCPPGHTSVPMHKEFIKPFLDSMKGYHHIIKGSFWGHLHEDKFMLFGNTSSSDFHAGHLVSTLGPNTNKQPSFRRYIFDSSKGYEVEDWSTYYMDLAHANKVGKIEWKHLYSAKSAYGIPDASAKSLHELAKQMQKDDATFKKVYSHVKGGYPMGSCEGSCKKHFVCSVLHAYIDEYDKCIA